MLDYLLIKQNNYILVVVYRGIVRACRDGSWCKLSGIHACGRSCAWSLLLYFWPFTFTEVMFDGHEDLFFLKKNYKSVSSTNGFTGKKQEGSEPWPEHKWKTYYLDFGCAWGKNESSVCHRKSHYSSLEIV